MAVGKKAGADGRTTAPHRRFYWAQVGVACAFLILLARLWQLQVLSGDHYFRKSADNFVKELELPAVRGQIRDRNGLVLADNRPAYDVAITPRFAATDPDDLAGELSALGELLGFSDDDVAQLHAKLAQKKGLDRFRALVIAEDVSRDRLAHIESQLYRLPGVSVSAVAHRAYPEGKVAGHVIGYMNQIAADELREHREEGYHVGDYVGRSGLERQWESFLRGKDGIERVIVDAKGQRKGEAELDFLDGALPRIEPVPGHHLITTVDLPFERAVEKALSRHKSAAAAVVDVQTGRILALGSWPETDPNELTGRLSHADADALANNPARPLIDKTTRENYYPGSTFKIVTALAALEDHLVDPDARVVCHGALIFGKRAFHCVEPHGSVDLHEALVQSCNVYFYGLGDHIGLDRIAREATEFGFGAPTGLGINGEVPGCVPTMAYYKEQPGGFQKGYVLNTAIGQGSLKVTVLQLAMAYAALANGGKLFVPQLVQRIETPDGRLVEEFPPQLRRQLTATSEQLAFVRQALWGAVEEEKGTSFAARVPGLSVAGKTGTAQVRNHSVDEEEGSEDAAHAWFASFAPAKKPEIAVVVLIEHGGFGAKAATPTAMEIYDAYFHPHSADHVAVLPPPMKHKMARVHGRAPAGNAER